MESLLMFIKGLVGNRQMIMKILMACGFSMFAILPIRAGSQRVNNKNITPVNNKPLYTYIVETLKQVKQVDKIIINTDYKIIHDAFSHDSRVDVMNREENLRGNCNINLVINEVLRNYQCEYFLQTHATNPLLKVNTISTAINVFFEGLKNTHDSLFSVTKVQKRFWSEQPAPINHKIADEPTTQSLETIYEENSCFYIFSRSSFENQQNRIGARPCIFPISKAEAIDIDDEEDLQIVKKLMA